MRAYEDNEERTHRRRPGRRLDVPHSVNPVWADGYEFFTVDRGKFVNLVYVGQIRDKSSGQDGPRAGVLHGHRQGQRHDLPLRQRSPWPLSQP